MTLCIVCSFFLAFSACLLLVSQPLVLGLLVMLMTFMGCMLGAALISPWYAYILFLVYVGGMLVMFAYVTALIPNVLFSSSRAFFEAMYWVPLLSSIFYFGIYSVDMVTMEPSSPKFLKYFGAEIAMSGMYLIIIGLGLILLLNLVAVVKICYKRGAALRSFQ